MALFSGTTRRCRAGLLVLAAFACAGAGGCHRSPSNELRVGVTPGPAEEVLQAAAPALKGEGVELKIVHFTDYIQPDLALAGHDLDANLYQNVPFMEQFNRDHATHFGAIAKVYVPLMGIYPGKTKFLAALPEGATVALPNDPVNQARALVLLQTASLITLRAGAGNRATVRDATGNPRNLKLLELDASQLPRSRGDVDLAVINANFALDAGLSPAADALVHESPDSLYVNVLAANEDAPADARVTKLAAALRSEAVRSFITAKYKGAIYPAS